MSFFVSIEQLGRSLERLRDVHPFFGMTFLAFKKAQVPVGEEVPINFAEINRAILQAYYRLPTPSDRYFSPFRTSGSGWVSSQHARTTLQRIAKDTFGDAFLHEPNAPLWGWSLRYLEVLQQHLPQKVPAFDLAAWLFRDREIAQDSRRAEPVNENETVGFRV